MKVIGIALALENPRPSGAMGITHIAI